MKEKLSPMSQDGVEIVVLFESLKDDGMDPTHPVTGNLKGR